MKAIKLGQSGGLDRIQPVDLPDPGQPGRGEIRVRVHASSLNYHDLRVALGDMPRTVGRIPMADGAGVVEALGEGVTEFAVGDNVVSTFFPTWLDGAPPPEAGNFLTVPGDGVDGYAREAVVLPATWFTKAPVGWSHAEAATLTTAAVTVWRALVGDGGLKAGDTILTLGTGGVSIFALQLAKAVGATVISTSSSEAKLARLRELGADHVINYKQVPAWGQAVMDLTGGRGVDQLIEVGGVGTLGQSVVATRVGGHISMIGAVAGASTEPPPIGLIMLKHIRLQGLIVGSRRQQQDLVRALDATNIRPVIDSSFPLEGLADAFRHESAGAHFGKICLEF